jgi:hypothetical protein
VVGLVAVLFALSIGASASETTLVGDEAAVSGAAQLAAAQDDDGADEGVEADELEGTEDADDLPEGLAEIEEKFEAFEACLAENGVDFEKFEGETDHPGFGFDFDHFDLEGLDLEEFDPENFDPAELDKLFEEKFGDFDGEGFELFDIGPDVSVMDDGELTIADFGDGDGTITVTKTGDDISVTSTGDVKIETVEPFTGLAELGEGLGFDFDFDFDFEPGEIPEFDLEGFPKLGELDDAFSTCEELLPEDIFSIGGIFGGPLEHHSDNA